jgi:hypothetical protein
MASEDCTATRQKRILVVGPFMHRLGHYSTFPHDLARGFALNGAQVTVLAPAQPALATPADAPYRLISLATLAAPGGAVARAAWYALQRAPILLALFWIALNTRTGDYDLVYWTDFKPDNQQSTWPLAIARCMGLYRHRTAFTEHYNFSWTRHRLQRLLRLDSLRLRKITLIVHSRKLLEWVRLNMAWPDKGHYVPWGLWPVDPTHLDRTAARRALGMAEDARVLLVFGMQAIRRKHVDTLGAAIDRMTLDRPLTLVFAGIRTSHDEEHPFDAPALLAKPQLTVMRHEHFLDDDAVTRHFAAADAVWACYRDFMGASGVLCQAIAHRRLALCADAAESGALVADYGFGLMPARTDVEGVQQTLCRFIGMSAGEQASYEANTVAAARELAWPRVAQRILALALAADD